MGSTPIYRTCSADTHWANVCRASGAGERDEAEALTSSGVGLYLLQWSLHPGEARGTQKACSGPFRPGKRRTGHRRRASLRAGGMTVKGEKLTRFGVR